MPNPKSVRRKTAVLRLRLPADLAWLLRRRGGAIGIAPESLALRLVEAELARLMIVLAKFGRAQELSESEYRLLAQAGPFGLVALRRSVSLGAALAGDAH